jgi:uncharacterized protein (DUF488 family)
MIQLFTIGFTGKSAERFFTLLTEHNVKKIMDTRIRPCSQLSGFAKQADLKYFAKSIGSMEYEHFLMSAPTKQLLAKYQKNSISWEDYSHEYLNLLDSRRIAQKVEVEALHDTCLLCSEHHPEKCHRRLLAEYFQAVRTDIQITHLF